MTASSVTTECGHLGPGIYWTELEGSDLPLRHIEEIKAEVERFCGGKPRKAQVTDNPVAVVKWVDGTVIDPIFQVES